MYRHQEVAIDAKIDSLAARFYSDIWCQRPFSRTRNCRTFWKIDKFQRLGLDRNLEAGLMVNFPSKMGFQGGFVIFPSISTQFSTLYYGKGHFYYWGSWKSPTFLLHQTDPLDPIWRKRPSILGKSIIICHFSGSKKV